MHVLMFSVFDVYLIVVSSETTVLRILSSSLNDGTGEMHAEAVVQFRRIVELVEDCEKLKDLGINSAAIMSNDTINYPDDSYENMIKFSAKHKFSFPYLIDETQEIAKKYDAVCTPDFFGYNKDLKLNYRGRIRELRDLKPIRNGSSELFEAMKLISETQKGPDIQKPSLGCSIKWFKK